VPLKLGGHGARAGRLTGRLRACSGINRSGGPSAAATERPGARAAGRRTPRPKVTAAACRALMHMRFRFPRCHFAIRWKIFFQMTLHSYRISSSPVLRTSLMFITGIHAFSETMLKVNHALNKPSAILSMLRQERIIPGTAHGHHLNSIKNPLRATFVHSRLQMSLTSDSRSPQRRRSGGGGRQRSEGSSSAGYSRGGGGASSQRTIDEAWAQSHINRSIRFSIPFRPSPY
jgi:uncharacterized membrane protein YgcG